MMLRRIERTYNLGIKSYINRCQIKYKYYPFDYKDKYERYYLLNYVLQRHSNHWLLSYIDRLLFYCH